MKIYKYLYKYVDHSKQLCTKLIGEVHCDTTVQWDKNGSYSNWMVEHVKWEENLKNIVKNLLLQSHGSGLNEREFKIKSVVHREEGEMVNMNYKTDNPNVVFRKKYWNEFNMTKLCKGMPGNNNELNYNKESHHLILQLTSGMSQNIQLSKLCESHRNAQKPSVTMLTPNNNTNVNNMNDFDLPVSENEQTMNVAQKGGSRKRGIF